jgi:SecD/SecF fusion protein
MHRWVYWASLAFIALVLAFPAIHLLTDPQAELRDLFRLGIDLEGGTSLIYELRAAEGAGEAPDAAAAKQVIMGRIDPQGTRGYIVRAVGKHRLEIVLPGRSKVTVADEVPTSEAIAEAAQSALRQQNQPMADLLKAKADAFLAGTRLTVHMNPPLYLEDIHTRIDQAARERMPGQQVAIAVVGTEASGDQWAAAEVFLTVPKGEAERVGEWKNLVKSSLSAQRDVTRVKRLVKQAGFLEFRIVADKLKDRDKANFDRIVRLKQAGQPPDDAQWRWYPVKKGWEWYTSPRGNLLEAWNFVYVVDKQSRMVEVLVNVGDGQDVTGRDLSRAVASVSEGEPVVSFQMNPTAGARFARLTSPEMRGRQMGIILDGVIQSAPSLKATLSTGGIIEGYKNRRELEEVVTVLNSGQLAASLGDPITERTVGPELGEDNIHNGMVASLIGVALVMVFMLVYYQFAGMVANTALTLNLVLTVCIMFVIRQTWTLPGIAGLILSLAMAVDANVLVYERLREEKGKEGSLGFALKKAYERAFVTIFDSNITTVIPAFVLLWPGLATEEVKGFAVVMIIGILVSMFTAVVVTRMIFETGLKYGFIRDIRMLRLFERPHFDWMKFARVAFVASGGLVVLGTIAFFTRGQEKYDIEFVGGTQVELSLKPPAGEAAVPIATVRERATQVLGSGAAVQELEYATETGQAHLSRFLISVPAAGAAVSGEQDVKAALLKAFEDLRPEGVGEKVQAAASEITEETVRQRLEGAAARAAPVPGAAPAAAGGAAPVPAETPAVRYLPPELRQFRGKIRVEIQVNPPLGTGEAQRRIDTFIRDRYPDVAATLYKVQGKTAAETSPGEFKTLELWVRDDFGGKRGDVTNAAFWTDVVRFALGQEEAFASTTSFEPTMAREAWDKAVVAILISLGIMAVYIWFRFARFANGVAAVVALIHDVLITLGAVSVAAYVADTAFGTGLVLTDMRINLPLIGAFLTLVGYSVNDTIVVFDRIRENRGKYGDLSISVVNDSVNQTLSRTVLTSFTVFVAVVSLYFFAGKTSSVHGFSFVMLFGTVVGTYSSIAIAGPILVQRDYLRKVYAAAYPILGLGLLVYFAAGWCPWEGGFFGSPAGWVWAVLQIAWFAVMGWAAWCDAYGKPWPLLATAPAAARAVAWASLLAPAATVILLAIAVISRSHMAWAGPAAVGAVATCPATYALWKMALRPQTQRH